MPRVVRDSGVDRHACGAIDIQGSPDVFVNGARVHRVGDGDSHGGIQAEGSPTTFANNRKVARIGDKHGGDDFHPPSPEATGSPDVWADG